MNHVRLFRAALMPDTGLQPAMFAGDRCRDCVKPPSRPYEGLGAALVKPQDLLGLPGFVARRQSRWCKVSYQERQTSTRLEHGGVQFARKTASAVFVVQARAHAGFRASGYRLPA